MKKAHFEVGPAQFNVTKSLRIDSEMAKELDLIALYMKIDPCPLMRMWVQDRIRSYQNNVRYRRWKREHKAEEKRQ